MLSEHLGNCFRLGLDDFLIQICSQEEMLAEIEKINQANAQLDAFLSGTIEEDDFLSFIEQYTPIDAYIENTNANLASWIGEWK